MFYVYRITHVASGRWYVGARTSARGNHPFRDQFYMGSGTRISGMIQKYGKEAFVKKVLVIAVSREEALRVEKALVDLSDPLCLNLVEGGIGASPSDKTRTAVGRANSIRTWSEESRQKIREVMTGTKRGPLSEKHKAKISASKRGYRHSEETKAKMRGPRPRRGIVE